MEKKQVALGKPVNISGVTVIPITQTQVYSWPFSCGANFFCFKRPLYVLVSTATSALKAFKMDGTETTLEAIREEYPELRTEFEGLAGE